MTWLVELPDPNGRPMLVNFDQPLAASTGDDGNAVLTTATGTVAVGLDYPSLCARLRLNAADRMPSPPPASARRLGRRPARRDRRVPTLDAIAGTLPAAPVRCTDYVDRVSSWILGRNDRIGDCTCVAPANVILALTTLAGDPRRLDDDTVVGFYSALTGYDPADPSTDNGAVVEDVLARWHASGIGGDRLDGYATLAPADHDRVREAIANLGPVDLGIDLPNGWMNAGTWDVSTAGAGIAGGHCVTAVGYTDAGPLIVSWGQVFTMTWNGWDRFVDEAHVLLSRDALTRAGKDAAGVDWATLERFMAAIRGNA